MRLVKFQTQYDGPVWVNPEHVVVVRTSQFFLGACDIKTTKETLAVQGTPKEVLNKLYYIADKE